MFIVKTFLKKAKAEQICKVTVYVFFRHRITCFRQKPQLGRKKNFSDQRFKKKFLKKPRKKFSIKQQKNLIIVFVAKIRETPGLYKVTNKHVAEKNPPLRRKNLFWS